MADAKAKTINLLLYEGDLEGVISIEDSSWNSGELYSAPRDSVSELLETDACKKYGVYLLLSKSMVYVGQSSDLSKRITQHTVGKDWWESVVILTTKDDSLTHSDIDYLESVLIDKAFKINRLDCDNKNKGNNPKVSKFQKLFLNDIPFECQEFVLELDKYLTEKGSKRTIKTAKSGFVTSYSSPKNGKALLNYVFRKNGVKIRVYAGDIWEYAEILSDFPDNMKKDIIKAGDCKKLYGLNCSPTCTGGYSLPMDGVVYRKCKNMAFFHSLEEQNFAAIRKLVESEIDCVDRG